MRADRHQHRRFDCFDDFVGALRLPKMPGVLAAQPMTMRSHSGRCFAENCAVGSPVWMTPEARRQFAAECRSRDRELDAAVGRRWVLDDAEEGDWAWLLGPAYRRGARRRQKRVPSLQIRMFIVVTGKHCVMTMPRRSPEAGRKRDEFRAGEILVEMALSCAPTAAPIFMTSAIRISTLPLMA